jgi:hypothetical protein
MFLCTQNKIIIHFFVTKRVSVKPVTENKFSVTLGTGLQLEGRVRWNTLKGDHILRGWSRLVTTEYFKDLYFSDFKKPRKEL